MFKVDLVSVRYAGMNIGRNLVFVSDINLHKKTFRTTLRPGHTFRPLIGSGELYSSSAIPAQAGATVRLTFEATEKDIFRDDKGSASCTFAIPKYSIRDQIGRCIVSVREGSSTANYIFEYKVTCTHPLFEKLWRNHPANNGIREPCKTGEKSNFENQCAIRMGVSLLDSGISLDSFPGAYCRHGHGKRHVLRTQELATWLAGQSTTFGPVMKASDVTDADFKGKVGIVFFKDFRGRGDQGDHIDVWDGEKMSAGSGDYFLHAKEVWFWRL